MLINCNNSETNHVKFVSYSGKYPNFCRGVLVLKIDGIEYCFGHEVGSYDFRAKNIKTTTVIRSGIVVDMFRQMRNGTLMYVKVSGKLM